MRKLLAILVDSVREASSTVSLWVLFGISTLLIVTAASMTFEGRPAGEVLRTQAERLHIRPVFVDVGVEIGEVRRVDGAGDGDAAALAGGHAVAIAFDDATGVDELLETWERIRRHRARQRPDAGVGRGPIEPPSGDADRQRRVTRYLEQRFASLGYEHVRVTPLGEPGTLRFEVAVRTDHPQAIVGAYRVGMFFGLVANTFDRSSPAEMLQGIQLGVADFMISLLGVAIAIFATAFFVPRMLQKGSLDLVLSRPIGRSSLLLGKYAGGILYVLLLATYLIGGLWLALSLRTGHYNPWFLATILTSTFKFAVLYAASVLFGVLTRSSITSLLLTYLFWFVTAMIVNTRHTIQLLTQGRFTFNSDGSKMEVPGWLDTLSGWVYALSPKLPDLDNLATWLIAQANLPAHLAEHVRHEIPEIDWSASVGSTGIWAAVLLVLACWRFHRRDW